MMNRIWHQNGGGARCRRLDIREEYRKAHVSAPRPAVLEHWCWCGWAGKESPPREPLRRGLCGFLCERRDRCLVWCTVERASKSEASLVDRSSNVIPPGITNVPSNCQLLCSRCHIAKSTREASATRLPHPSEFTLSKAGPV